MIAAARLIDLVRSKQNRTAVIGSGSRVFALGSQFIIVLVLTRLLAKSEFGNFMIAFAGYRVLASGIGTGMASVLLYHVSRSVEDHDIVEVRLHRGALLLGGLLGLLLCFALWYGAPAIATAFAKPTLMIWLRAMTPFLLATLLATITTGAYEGRSRVATAIMLNEVAPNFIRLVLLGAIPLLHLGEIMVAPIMAISAALPWILSIRHLFARHVRGVRWFSRWDYGYATKLTFYNFAALQVQGIDMIIAGWLFSAESVADYAVASRIGALFPFFQQLRVRMFGPVAGRLLGAKDHDALQREVMAAKDFSMILVTSTAAALLLASPIFLQLFWKSGTLAQLLVLLAFPPVYRSLFAAGDRLLQLAGHADWNLGIMLTALAIVVIVPMTTGPTIGIISLPIAMIISGFLLNPVIAYGVRRMARIDLLVPSDALIAVAAALSVAVPLIWSHGAMLMFWSGGMFLALALTLLVLGRRRARIA